MSDTPGLFVFCPSGLSNRLKVLVSGKTLAEAAGRQFTMLWKPSTPCNSGFSALFENDWNVVATEKADLPALQIIPQFVEPPDLFSRKEKNLYVSSTDWLLYPYIYPWHMPLLKRCEEIFAALQPVPALQKRLASFREDNFRGQMIGVHLRRGDFHQYRPDAIKNTPKALALVDHLLDSIPDVGILLCTDDGAPNPNGKVNPPDGVLEQFQKRYGSRLVTTRPVSLDRKTPEAIRDALVDLWLLRSVDFFIGTRGSSFSGLAVYGRDIPFEMTSGEPSNLQETARGFQRQELNKLLISWARHKLGQNLPFPFRVRYWANIPRRLAQFALKAIMPERFPKRSDNLVARLEKSSSEISRHDRISKAL